MLGTRKLRQIRDALAHLNPNEVRASASQDVTIELHASHPDVYFEMERFLLEMPGKSSLGRRDQIRSLVWRAGDSNRIAAIHIQEVSPFPQPGAFVFDPENPGRTVEEILDARPELGLALARQFQPFRQCMVARTIKSVAKENALFSVATAVPSIVPFVSLPWAVGEFASDTAFLTMNQIRMAFMLAAASDRAVGYREQRNEIASIVASAFGWRAIARELIGKVPFGGGIIPKAAIAYAGTFVVGLSLERLFRLGYGYTRAERKAAFETAFERGKTVVSAIVAATQSQAHGSR